MCVRVRVRVRVYVCVSVQYYTSTGLPSRKLEPGVCAVCGNRIIVLDNADAIVEKTYKLSCDHVYPSLTVCLVMTVYVAYRDLRIGNFPFESNLESNRSYDSNRIRG